MRALPLCLVALFVSGGCATRAASGLDVLAETRGPVDGQVVRQSVDLRHTEYGWVTVEFDASNRMVWRLERDTAAPSTAALPQGRYDSVRIKSLTSVPSNDARSSAVSWVATEALVHEDFCIGSKDPQLALQVVRDARSERTSSQLSLDAPCEPRGAVADRAAPSRSEARALRRRDRP